MTLPARPGLAPGPRRSALAPALLVAAAFRLPRLGFPPEEVFDEVYHAKTALQYLQRRAADRVGAPADGEAADRDRRLGLRLRVLGLAAAAGAGRDRAGARSSSCCARRVLPSERAALLASVLLLCDGVYLVQSRIAMTNIFAVLFQVAAALFIVRAVRRETPAARRHARGRPLPRAWRSPRAGRACGRRASWACVAARVRAAPALPPARARCWWCSPSRRCRSRSTCSATCPGCGTGPRACSRVIELAAQAIWRYHANLRATHPYFSKWYTWPWLYRPTWYYLPAGRAAGCAASSPSATRRCGGCRCRVPVGAHPGPASAQRGPRPRRPRGPGAGESPASSAGARARDSACCSGLAGVR